MIKLSDQFNSVSFLDKVQIGKLNFYPINFDLKEMPKNLKSLDELFDLGLLKVTELSDEGVVGRVEVYNDSEFNLLVLDGEAIKGAKQNRGYDSLLGKIVLTISNPVLSAILKSINRWIIGFLLIWKV